MKFDFSIESAAEQINNSKTRDYFDEVYKTFANENYRSSIVMLYSVLICDLIFKLRDLRDLYKDMKAKKILDDIEAIQLANPKSPEWEVKLIEFIRDRTTLLEASDIVAIESLQKFRHLSAHPVLTNADLLYSPNRETTQALIRNILEGILTSPPFFSNKIFDTFLSDLSDIKDKIIDDDEALEAYLQSRYLKHIKEIDFKKLFRSFWKVVFISDDQPSKDNRRINFKALRIIFRYKRALCVESIKEEPSYYSNITKETPLFNLCILLAVFTEVYECLDASLQLLIDKQIEQNEESKLIGWFKAKSLDEHFGNLDPKQFKSISSAAYEFVKRICKENGKENLAINFFIRHFGHSTSYEDTKTKYNQFIKSILPELTKEQAETLLSVSENNSQIRNKMGMSYDLKQFVDERFSGTIDKSQYPKLFPPEKTS